jgi:hypothetical protein
MDKGFLPCISVFPRPHHSTNATQVLGSVAEQNATNNGLEVA